MASLLRDQQIGKYDILAIQELWCNPFQNIDHPGILTVTANLASLFLDQERWEEAERLNSQALEISMEHHGGDHNVTLQITSHMVYIWESMGKASQAQDILYTFPAHL